MEFKATIKQTKKDEFELEILFFSTDVRIGLKASGPDAKTELEKGLRATMAMVNTIGLPKYIELQDSGFTRETLGDGIMDKMLNEEMAKLPDPLPYTYISW